MKAFFSITITALKMLFRNKQSLFFTWFLPLFLMLIIGYVTRETDTTIRLGVVYNHDNPATVQVVSALRNVDALEITDGTIDDEKAQLQDNKRDIVAVLPETFSFAPADQQPITVTLYENQSNPAQSAIGVMIVRQFFQEMSIQATHAPQLFQFATEQLSAKTMRYVDFLVPGILAMTIMQLGIFGTAFSIVDAKQKGILKRIIATPVRPWQFVIGNMLARLTLSLTQAIILITVAALVFDVHFSHWGWLTGLIVIGNIIFLSLGLFISGVAKTVESVPVLANLIAFPMMLLGGVFFPTTNLPEWLKVIVDKLPIAILADLLRKTTTLGKTLSEVWLSLLLLIVWAIVALLLANFFFRVQERE